MCKAFKNYNKTFADHLFISSSLLELMENDPELEVDIFGFLNEAKTTIEKQPRGKRNRISAYIRDYSYDDGVRENLHLIIQREWIGNSVIATIMPVDEVPVREKPYKPTIKDHIFMWRLKRAVKNTLKEATR